jgi:transposase-like protein
VVTVERATNWIIVDNRSRELLISIIKKTVKPGSYIYSDSWSAYLTLNKEGYEHFTVCHKDSFKQIYRNVGRGEIVEAHTNRIEGAWAHAKHYFTTMSGSCVSTFESHLCVIMWRNWLKTGVFGNTCKAFYNDIKSIYHLSGEPVYMQPEVGPISPT